MPILCRLGFHSAIPSKLWNDGHYFSACKRCGRDLIRVPNGDWMLVPPNLKVVWKSRTEHDIDWPSHLL